jgi:TPP-dependent indolepyruvate ferredoxin oxidoreductase alpha subunit
MNVSLDDRYRLDEGAVYLSGIQALVRTVRDRARLDRRDGRSTASFIAGYEGSPLAGFDLELARRKKMLDEFAVVHRPGVNEELAATSVMGSQLASRVGTLTHDGVTGYWYGKSPGLDRASDAIRHANLIGTDPRGGAVAIVGDDPAGKSSSLACSSELALADLTIPTLYPADAQEVLDFGLHAPYLSRLHRDRPPRARPAHVRGPAREHLPPRRQAGRREPGAAGAEHVLRTPAKGVRVRPAQQARPDRRPIVRGPYRHRGRRQDVPRRP